MIKSSLYYYIHNTHNIYINILYARTYRRLHAQAYLHVLHKHLGHATGWRTLRVRVSARVGAIAGLSRTRDYDKRPRGWLMIITEQ